MRKVFQIILNYIILPIGALGFILLLAGRVLRARYVLETMGINGTELAIVVTIFSVLFIPVFITMTIGWKWLTKRFVINAFIIAVTGMAVWLIVNWRLQHPEYYPQWWHGGIVICFFLICRWLWKWVKPGSGPRLKRG